jgi:phage terminase small subunit
MSKFKPPQGLSKRAAKFWAELQHEYSIDDPGGQQVLTSAAESLDRQWQAAEILDREGLVIADRFQQQRPHPCCAIERDSRNGFLAAMRWLNLEPEKGGI